LAPILLALGCPPRLPLAETTHHRGHVPVRVPYPPPAAQVEIVPPQPTPEAVWVDGFYRWTGRDYDWTAGAWVVPQPGTKYAPPTAMRLRDGTLVYYEGTWRRTAGE
jgi:hypothetical protein